MVNNIQSNCKKFRLEVLKQRVEDMSKKTGVKSSTISSFENGYSNNINHLFNYVVSCETKEQLKKFHEIINESLSIGDNNV